MQQHALLGQLSGLQQMQRHLFESIPEAACYQHLIPSIPSLAWLFGRGIYLECYWLREVVEGDASVTDRIRGLFSAHLDYSPEASLPDRDHLLNWGLELQDENLMRLANPALLPHHPLIEGGQLLPLILSAYAELYELSIALISSYRLHQPQDHQVTAPLLALTPSSEHANIYQGHYRIGAKEEPEARDCELPTQMVELSAFRIDKYPVTNGAFLSFMQAGGYEDRQWWSTNGWAWCQNNHHHPYHWRQDANNQWYGVGVNGAADLHPTSALCGINQYEALAYACWVASRGAEHAGAVVQHEYQWEVAARTGEIKGIGEAWEWCANPFHAYTGYVAPQQIEAGSRGLDEGDGSLRGASLHTQRCLRRSSYRHHATPDQQFHLSGTRLVFPPAKTAWQK